MKKYIIASIIAITLLIPVTAKKTAAAIDYNELAANADEKEIKAAYKAERSLFYKSYYDGKETFLHLCLKKGRPLSIIKMCVDYESDTNAKTKDGRTPLSYASQYSSDPKIIELLVKTSAMTASKKRRKILQVDENGKNAFHYAKENPASSIYARLCEFTDDPNVYSKDDGSGTKKNPVDDIAAVEAELKKEAEELEAMTYREPQLSGGAVPSPAPVPIPVASLSYGKDNNEENAVNDGTDGNAMATEAVQDGPDIKKQEVEAYASAFLLDYAEEPKAEEESAEKITFVENPDFADKNDVTLLMKAAKAGNDWDVRNLLASGANVNLRDKDGWTALMYAVRYQNSLNIITMLIEKGAYVRVRNKFNATPLLMAADYSKNPEILAVLLKNRSVSEDEVFRAFVFCITGNANSSHVRAAKVKLFLEMNIPLNRLWKGQTPLMYAAQYATSTDVIQQLLDAGADPALTDENGMSAFDYAKKNRRLPEDGTFWSLNGTK